MSSKVLITGGAGFIGSHLADELIARGYRVRALDNLSPQVHGGGSRRPAYLADAVDLLIGDVRDSDSVHRALDGVDVVCHMAAMVGVGQSMYEIRNYTDVNNLGTAVLLEALAKHPVKKLIVASSMSIYGEGLYRRPTGQVTAAAERGLEQLKSGDWEVRDASGNALTPLPTPESKTPWLSSVYALSKYDQERLCLLVGRVYNIPTVALRFFNVYGTRQALSNPYTGVLAIFAARLLNGNGPLIYEDGHQRRDFVNVRDVARACALAVESPAAAGHAINIGSGQSSSVLEIAMRMSTVLERSGIQPQVTGKYRAGDIRHCFADITLARELLGYHPQVTLDQGLAELAEWLSEQVATDRVEEARAELEMRGLAV